MRIFLFFSFCLFFIKAIMISEKASAQYGVGFMIGTLMTVRESRFVIRYAHCMRIRLLDSGGLRDLCLESLFIIALVLCSSALF